MTVPGAVLPVAGVSAVAVLPTHRRRGVLRSLMHRQVADIAARGEEPVAALWAAEAPIYGRYGYGRAASIAYFEFRRGEGALDGRAPADPALTLRLAAPGAVTTELARVYDAVRARQPGFFARDEDWWGRALHDMSQERPEASPLRCLLAEDGSGVRGYAVYVAKDRWDDATGLPDGSLLIRELIAADPAAGAALWQNLLDRDLITSVTAELRPADDPVLYQLLDQRRARAQAGDGIWVRIIDLPAALGRRAYAAPVDVVLEVTDPLLAGNAGRWRLRTAAPGPGCDLRADRPAGRRRARHPRPRRRLPRRHPPRHAGRGGPGPRAPPGHPRAAVRRHDLGPGPVVPADLLGDTGVMPVTKITLSTAMRARDVSRPHAEHLTEAAQREDAAARPAETHPPRPARPPAPGLPVRHARHVRHPPARPARPRPCRSRHRPRPAAAGAGDGNGGHRPLTPATGRGGQY